VVSTAQVLEYIAQPAKSPASDEMMVGEEHSTARGHALEITGDSLKVYSSSGGPPAHGPSGMKRQAHQTDFRIASQSVAGGLLFQSSCSLLTHAFEFLQRFTGSTRHVTSGSGYT
jgi:hypothetical protein